MPLATAKKDAEQETTHQPEPTPPLHSEKVRGDEDVHMDTDKLSPGRGFLAFGGWRNAVAF